MTEPPVRVIVVDDDPQVQADLEDMLEPLGYDVRAAEGQGETLIQESKRIARTLSPPHCHRRSLPVGWPRARPERAAGHRGVSVRALYPLLGLFEL